MTLLVLLGDVACFLAGGAVVWVAKEPLLLWYKGAENYVGALNDKIKAVKAKL